MTHFCGIKWRGIDAIVMENPGIRIMVLPGLGAKLASIVWKRSNGYEFELAAQPVGEFCVIPDKNTRFDACDAAGIDDAFPTVDPAVLPGARQRFSYTDHGEIWRSGFTYEVDGESLRLSLRSRENPFLYVKEVSLRKNAVCLNWHIENTGSTPFPFLWTMHGLVRYEADMELIYPEEIKEFINVIESRELGKIGSVHPVDGDWDFCRVPAPGSETMMKYYARERVKSGRCGYYYPGQGVRCILGYDADKLPWLGLWITAGGFRGDYNLAWEPSSGFYDSVSRAEATGTLSLLEPDHPFEIAAQYIFDNIDA